MMSVFSERLRTTMEERGFTQIRLSEMTGIPKSAISQYLSDRFKPKRDRTYLICRVLEVDPAWLLGLSDKKADFRAPNCSQSLSEDEIRLVQYYRDHPELRDIFRHIIGEDESTTAFRAAKAKCGNIAPSREIISDERIKKLKNAPFTDEDV